MASQPPAPHLASLKKLKQPLLLRTGLQASHCSAQVQRRQSLLGRLHLANRWRTALKQQVARVLQQAGICSTGSHQCGRGKSRSSRRHGWVLQRGIPLCRWQLLQAAHRCSPAAM